MKLKFDCILGATILSLGLIAAGCGGSSSKSEYVSVQLDGSNMWSVLNVDKGEVVVSDEFFAPVTSVVNGAFFMQTDNGTFDLYNLSDTKNKLNRDSYSFVSNFNKNGYAIVRVNTEPWQIIDTKGVTIATLDKNIEISGGFSDDGLARMTNADGMNGYVDEKGQVKIAPKYPAARPFNDGAAVVLVKNEDGKSFFDVIDTKGETLFKFNTGQYSNISNFNDGHAFAVEGDHVVLLDKNGKKVATVGDGTNLSSLSYKNGKFIYSDGEFYGVKSTDGNILLRAKYGELQFIGSDKLLARNSNGKYGVVDTKDDIVLAFDYNYLDALTADRFITDSGSLKVLINDQGKEVCKQAFKNVVNRNESDYHGAQTNIITSQNNNDTFNSYSSEDLDEMVNAATSNYGYDMSTYGANMVDYEYYEEPDNTIPGKTLHFSGEVGDYPVDMVLVFDENDNVSGTYKYLKSGNGESIALNGTYYIVDYGYEADVTLQERYNGTVSATWNLKVFNGSDPLVTGTMVTSAGKNFKVSLE